MDSALIISKMNGFMHAITVTLADWLLARLSHVCDDWWSKCVLDALSYYQRDFIVKQDITTLKQLDLAALLRIADKNWYELRNIVYLTQSERECVRHMATIRNTWAHCAGIMPGKELIQHDAEIVLQFSQQIGLPADKVTEIKQFIASVQRTSIDEISTLATSSYKEEKTIANSPQCEIKEKDTVTLKSNPEMKGMVFAVSEIGAVKKYEVFIDGHINSYYYEQLKLMNDAPEYKLVDIQALRSYLTAFQLRNPSSQSLYSLNSARIDFVPYQFRPALKMIKSDTPRILIADSVGVGKTIEAGLILKEAQARNDIESVIIICPKPLVAERKWQLEMKRFDEEFSQVDGPALKQIILDADRDGVWPDRANKVIIPYSILQKEDVLFGSKPTKSGSAHRGSLGLVDLDPEPHFDMVIVDEAHHIRNNNTNSYATVKYFCDHAESVIFLTATPLQTSDNDLYTLLNLLRPDVILDYGTFQMMGRPNPYISRTVHLIRAATAEWQNEAVASLQDAALTQWGGAVINQNPAFKRAMETLSQNEITREERIRLISDVESLHSFFGIINRTRRQDIQDFCIRRSCTQETSFTPAQKELYDELLQFEAAALTLLHGDINVRFMMCTIMRQAASCLFGLAPFINALIHRRLLQIWDDPEYDLSEYEIKDSDYPIINGLAQKLLLHAEALPIEDPKFDALLRIVEEKQKYDNNKIILFSTFKHTLAYLRSKLQSTGLRIAQIDGSVKDEDRYALRGRFQRIKEDPQAIDIMLFTEVGSEGLDYQFCDLMINYDLPWNPMRIEQRIGRIDRRGQKSEAVSIYNMITAETIDATIFHRCLSRIGVFEESIGECSEILGQLHTEIENIMLSPSLTDEEKAQKLEIIADNEIRKIQELRRLENEEKQLFGFDLSNYIFTKEVQDAENPWISPSAIQATIQQYLKARLGDGNYVLGESSQKALRLSSEARQILFDDYKTLSLPRSRANQEWVRFLKQASPTCAITFDGEFANQNQDIMFITNQHPLVKQAVGSLCPSHVLQVGISINDLTIPNGEYPFAIYAWDYIGYKSHREIVPVCKEGYIQKELMNMLLSGKQHDIEASKWSTNWIALESSHHQLWKSAQKAHKDEASESFRYKTESLSYNFNGRKRILLSQVAEANDERIRRMRTAELENAEIKYRRKNDDLKLEMEKADIHTQLLVEGVLVLN